jgi:glycosyltransferase involved in cell wall biosynthesis
MRIAQIAPVATRVPPKTYGGTERVVHALTEELVTRGHEVTLFASGDSLTSAHLDSVYPINLRDTDIEPLYGLNAVLYHHMGHAYKLWREFDIIHDHTAHAGLPFAELVPTPVVMTMHGHIPKLQLPMFAEFQKANLVSISRDQQIDQKKFNNVGVVHNGLQLESYPFSNEHDNYLLYVGRICENKGTREAIQVAKKLKLPLIIAAKLDSWDGAPEYFAKYIKHELNDQIRWIGEVTEAQRNKLMSRALAFLHPGLWREPFGLTMIEAMACGAPVLAFNRGAVPEIVKNGVSGFVVETVPQMVAAVKKIATIDRVQCRAYALKYFSASRMAQEYEKVYEKVLTNPLLQKRKQIFLPTRRIAY